MIIHVLILSFILSTNLFQFSAFQLYQSFFISLFKDSIDLNDLPANLFLFLSIYFLWGSSLENTEAILIVLCHFLYNNPGSYLKNACCHYLTEEFIYQEVVRSFLFCCFQESEYTFENPCFLQKIEVQLFHYYRMLPKH